MYAPSFLPLSSWRHGLDFYSATDYYNLTTDFDIWGGVGIFGIEDSKNRLYFTHVLTPWQSNLVNNIVSNDFNGIGILTLPKHSKLVYTKLV